MKIIFAVLLIAFSLQGFAQDLQVTYQKGKQQFEGKNYKEAIISLSEVLKTDKENVMAFYLRGKAQAELKANDQAIEDFTQAINLFPSMADAYFQRAQSWEAKGKKEEALADYTSATILDGKQAAYFYKKGELQNSQKNYLGAVLDYYQAEQLTTDIAGISQKRRETAKKLTKEDMATMLEIAPATAASFGGTTKANPDDANTAREKKYINEHKFASLSEAKGYYNALMVKTGFTQGKKAVLYGLLRQKALKDLYGDAPYKEELEEMKTQINRERWLQPEGLNYYFKMTENSPNWFSAGVQRKDTYYFYKVMRSKAKNTYEVQIHAVKNKESNLVFNSQISVSEDSTGRNIDVFSAENRGYMWKVSSFNYLRHETKMDSLGNKVEQFVPIGDFEGKKQSDHGLPKEKYETLLRPVDSSLRARIKTILNHFILDYNSLFIK